MSSDT